MAIRLPPLTYRLVKGSPLTAEEMDNNLRILSNGGNAAFAILEVSLNPNGTLKANSVNTAAIQDRAVTMAKLSNIFIGTATGTDTYALALTPALSAYADGQLFFVKIPNANATTVPTLNVDGLGAVNIRKLGNNPVAIGDLTDDQYYIFFYDTQTAPKFQIIGTLGGVVPTGIQIIDTPGAGNFVVPNGVTTIDVVGIGGGGGGGGTLSTGRGGGGGGYFRKVLTVTGGQTISYVVGAGGIGADSGGGNSTDGDDTTFNGGAYVAGGGSNGDAGAGAGGLASGGDQNVNGQVSYPSVSGVGSTDKPIGGASPLGYGTGGYVYGGGASFVAPFGYGGGGGGDADGGGGFDTTDGGNGVLIIRW